MIKLIAFDLDGTLLTTDKKVTARAVRALKTAHEQGIVVAPATGRLQKGLPSAVTDMDFIRYAIMLNGGLVRDMQTGKDIFKHAFSKEESLIVWDAISGFDAMTDVYLDDHAYMDAGLFDHVPEYCVTEAVIDLVHNTRDFVPSVRDIMNAHSGRNCAEKFNVYFRTSLFEQLKPPARKKLEELPFLNVSTSVINNLELNPIGVDKGVGIKALCDHLGIDISEAMAIGDGENDVEMLRTAGLGVAMKNSEKNIQDSADVVSDFDNDHEGFAAAIEKYALL